ncbi:MAG: SEC-C domain-containing protein [Acidimicrobiales bacterium]
MAGVGRNQPCWCGSGVKVKRCCGVARGPSGPELAKAFLVEQRRASSPALRRAIRDVDALIELYEAVAELPRLDLSCQLRLPRLLTLELERLRAAIADDDDDEMQRALPDALAQVDNVFVRVDLARAVLALREAERVPEQVAAAALLDLDSDANALVREALIAALAVDCGAACTPSGLVLAG